MCGENEANENKVLLSRGFKIYAAYVKKLKSTKNDNNNNKNYIQHVKLTD